MDEQAIFDKMLNILRSYTKDSALLDKATMNTNILGDLKVNSARLVDIIIQCEESFGIEIEDEEADKIATIGDAVRIVKNRLG